MTKKRIFAGLLLAALVATQAQASWLGNRWNTIRNSFTSVISTTKTTLGKHPVITATALVTPIIIMAVKNWNKPTFRQLRQRVRNRLDIIQNRMSSKARRVQQIVQNTVHRVHQTIQEKIVSMLQAMHNTTQSRPPYEDQFENQVESDFESEDENPVVQDPVIQEPTVQELIECIICLDEKSVDESHRFSCGHSFCKECLIGIINTGLADRSTATLRCPDPARCRIEFEENDIRQITNNNRATIALFLDVKMQEWITTQPNAKHCPTPDCNWVFVNEDETRETISCPQCNNRYCSNCLLNHPVRLTCTQARELAENENNTRDPETQQWMQANSKPCPMCQIPIQKNEGCNHMTCRNCRYEFCWICLRERRDLFAPGHESCGNWN